MSTTIVSVIIALLINIIYGQQTCYLTQSDVLGPYYLPGAPKSIEQLCANSPAHDRLILTGKVVDYDSKCTTGIPYAKLDLWQANYDGVYSAGKSESDWFCRGVFQTDANGNFRITTIMPGRYNDNGYRPAHIHFNITAYGYPKLVTQLCFSNDYYLSSRDSCSHCHSDSESLQVSTNHRNDLKTYEGDWTIVLSRKTRIAFPPMSKDDTQRGSYIHVQQHIMN